MKYCDQCPNGYPDYAVTCPAHGGALHEIRELRPGMVIHKAYRIVRKLGQGGMGTVYLADHLYMQEQRALKFLSWELCQDEAFTSRFRQEVRTLQRIHHKNVVDCGDLEPAEDDSLFFPMEFVDGPDLWEFLRASTILLDVELALSLMIGITEGLSAAHALGLVHRDIKPENVLLAQSGEEWIPKIADFGIVAIKESGNTRTRTKTGASLLTMEYAAPEQWRGMRAGELDGRTDIYALGGVFYQMLTGQAVFEAESYEEWAEHHRESIPVRPGELRPELAEWPGLDELVLQMLAKDRNLRPANTSEILSRLRTMQHVVPGSGSGGRPANRHETLIEIPQTPFQATNFVPPPPPAKSATGPHQPPTLPLHSSLPQSGFTPPVSNQVPPPLPGSFGSGFVAGPGVTGGSSGTGGAYQGGHTPSQGAGLISNTGKTGTGGNTVPPKPGKWIPLALAAMVLFAVGGLIYYFHSKKPAEDTQYIPPTPQVEPKQDTPAPSVTPTTPADKPVTPTPFTPTETVSEKVARAQTLYKAKRYTEAAPLFSDGCVGDNALACNQLGYLYEEGLGVPKLPTRAVPLYQKGCDLNNEVACFNLGAMYNQAVGVKQDYAKAAQLYGKSCDANDSTACNSLGIMYHSGHGVAVDLAKADTLYAKACTGGEAAACSNLGDAYLQGDGVTKDVTQAKTYLNKGCTMGDKWGCDKLKGIS